MPICSYILYPSRGSENSLQEELSSWDGVVNVSPSEDKSVFILGTDTPNETSERLVKDKLAACQAIECYTLT
jgi:hypothetical protein